MTVTIFHNPACGTSRKALELIRERGYEPVVVEYLKAGWEREQLSGLLAAMGKTPAELLRRTNSPAAELVQKLGLDLKTTTDKQIIDAMIAHPILVQRPIVVTPRGTCLARPPETVLSIL